MVHIQRFPSDGLQPIPRDSVNKGMAAMLLEQTKEVLEKSFVYVHQHGGDDVTWKPLTSSRLLTKFNVITTFNVVCMFNRLFQGVFNNRKMSAE